MVIYDEAVVTDVKKCYAFIFRTMLSRHFRIFTTMILLRVYTNNNLDGGLASAVLSAFGSYALIFLWGVAMEADVTKGYQIPFPCILISIISFLSNFYFPLFVRLRW